MPNQPTQTPQEENAKKSFGQKPNLDRAEAQVRENEDASLQDDSYTFDSDNTDSEEGIDDFDVSDVGLDNGDDFV